MSILSVQFAGWTTTWFSLFKTYLLLIQQHSIYRIKTNPILPLSINFHYNNIDVNIIPLQNMTEN